MEEVKKQKDETWSFCWLTQHMGEQYGLVNREKFAKGGVWDKEPDFIVFRYRGYLCWIRRNPMFGHLCGYIMVPKGHPWHGQNFWSLMESVDIHGDVTLAEPDEDPDNGGWIVGFDCNHGFDSDLRLAWVGVDTYKRDNYKDVGYVHEEILSLARQADEAMTKAKEEMS